VTTRPPVGAAVDLGSNSVHLLVATITGHRLRPLVDESAFLGLGAAVDSRAHLGVSARDELVATLERYVTTARQLGAAEITLMGTEPIRRAADGGRIVRDVGIGCGVPLHVLSHEEEAYLTLIGTTHGRPVTHETLVVDIGGGSSEFCAIGPHSTARAAGLRIGSNRLTADHVDSDPASDDEIARMLATADTLLGQSIEARPREVVIVGGTASNLLKVTNAGTSDQIITRARLAEALGNLTMAPAEQIAERYILNPTRARILPAGAAIVDALMRRYGVARVRVSEAGMREGAILVADHQRSTWRDRLTDLAHGWRT
jgi:exopolyphosphatase / guanosine-5'-triphosphate,3'-diphosphate pyrophosphatase